MEVTARAPGKIILSGEHAVVHGSTAVVASIDLYTFVSLRLSTSENDCTLRLLLKDVGLELSWDVGKIKAALPESDGFDSSTPTTCTREFSEAISALVAEQNIPEAKIGPAGISAFLWLYTSIRGFEPATVVVKSELPLGSGLGSSAALSVALAAALLASLSPGSLDSSKQGWLDFEDDKLDLLNRWAFEGEKILHGKPSGIDNTVSTYGSIIEFKSGNLTMIKSNLPLKMLITNTKVERNTKALVAGVSERTLRHPEAMASVFRAMDSISTEFSMLIQSPATDELAITENEKKIAELMEMNQGLLQCLGVSHAVIETVLRTTLKYKLTSKLTGAGAGGCVLTLLPSLLSGTLVDKVIAELESCGFQCLIAGIGGKGAQVSFISTS
ncbi:hypothetical protein MLD38_020671 [Melastoma candidum]|uniref:Uncharacterized protein n=1 Tax=Melastoma candidum TaxID=119954 RepID=A0ACB9QDS7_9MYRT|nr:hypothetical protein MLD38_020671 [Melastoma candidum]